MASGGLTGFWLWKLVKTLGIKTRFNTCTRKLAVLRRGWADKSSQSSLYKAYKHRTWYRRGRRFSLANCVSTLLISFLLLCHPERFPTHRMVLWIVPGLGMFTGFDARNWWGSFTGTRRSSGITFAGFSGPRCREIS